MSTGSFKLPIGDSKNEYCKPFNFVKIFENGELVETFRIMPTELVKTQSSKEITYTLEGVLGMLLDNIMFQYNEVGGSTVKTADVLNYILNKQSKKNFVLGVCDFDRQFQYSWENENLLSAIFSIPVEFDEDYIFETDTTSYPFKLSLRKPSTNTKAYIRYEKNLKGITKSEDSSVIATRLYGLGYGEGVNQLNIISENPTGKPYIEAEKDYIDKYGIVEKIWVDKRYTRADNLYFATLTKLNELKQSKITYTIDALELYKVTKLDIDKFDVGDIVNVRDDELNINVLTRVVKKAKFSIEKDDISVRVELADIRVQKNELSSLYERTSINELYSQGATTINNYSFNSNCDTNYPAVIRFKIPNEAVNINKIELSFRVDKFRAFTKGAAASGIQTTNQSSITTTTSGGGQTSSSSSRNTTTSGGGQTSSSSSRNTTTSGGGQTSSSSSRNTTTSGGGQTVGTDYWTSSGTSASKHNHGIPDGIALATASGGSITWRESGDHVHQINDHSHNMDHTHTVADHNHDMNHTHTVADHNHDMDHTHTVNDHSHNMAHTHTLGEHSHQQIYGIYEASESASTFEIIADGNTLSLKSTTDDYNIVDYLTKDTDGKITRGWHELKIKPNTLCMINADIMVQVFVNSRGGTTL